MIRRFYFRLFVCPRIGHSPGFYTERPICCQCGGVLPGVWSHD